MSRSDRRNTYIVDIDGVIIKQTRDVGWQWYDEYELANMDVLTWLRECESDGHHIVLMTARPEHCRDRLVKLLAQNRVPYHQLVMGVPNGPRCLVMDVNGQKERTAYHVNLDRNAFNLNEGEMI